MTSRSDKAGGGNQAAPPAFRFVIEEGKAHEFAQATGADGLASRNGELIAPATFLTASQLWMKPENSPWHGKMRDYRHVLHGQQRFEYLDGPPRVGERFQARQSFGASYEKNSPRGALSFQEVITRFWRETEEKPAAVMTSLSITLTTPRKQAAEVAAPFPPLDTPAGALDVHTTAPLTITDSVRYQGASGDFNPVHHDAEFAKAGGHLGPITVGMLTAGIAAERFRRLRDPHALRFLQTQWKTPAWPGERLTYSVTEHTNGLNCTVTKDNGHLHMTARAEYL